MKPLDSPCALTLYQALSPGQFATLQRKRWRCIPSATGEQACQLKLSQRYAEMIARQWTLPTCGRAYVVELCLPAQALAPYELASVAYEEHLEYRIPPARLEALATQLLMPVRLVALYRPQHSFSVPETRSPLTGLMG